MWCYRQNVEAIMLTPTRPQQDRHSTPSNSSTSTTWLGQAQHHHDSTQAADVGDIDVSEALMNARRDNLKKHSEIEDVSDLLTINFIIDVNLLRKHLPSAIAESLLNVIVPKPTTGEIAFFMDFSIFAATNSYQEAKRHLRNRTRKRRAALSLPSFFRTLRDQVFGNKYLRILLPYRPCRRMRITTLKCSQEYHIWHCRTFGCCRPTNTMIAHRGRKSKRDRWRRPFYYVKGDRIPVPKATVGQEDATLDESS